MVRSIGMCGGGRSLVTLCHRNPRQKEKVERRPDQKVRDSPSVTRGSPSNSRRYRPKRHRALLTRRDHTTLVTAAG